MSCMLSSTYLLVRLMQGRMHLQTQAGTTCVQGFLQLSIQVRKSLQVFGLAKPPGHQQRMPLH